MTNLITEARELCERTVPAPWRTKDRGDYIEIHDNNTWAKSLSPFARVEGDEFDSADFIARSRTLIPELCDALEKAEEQNKQLLHELCKLACESVKREKVLAKLEAEVEGWAKAKQEGRLVVLPCNVGDTVYKIAQGMSLYKSGLTPYIAEITPKSLSQICQWVEEGYYLGKTVFLTREEAEAALKGEQP